MDDSQGFTQNPDSEIIQDTADSYSSSQSQPTTSSNSELQPTDAVDNLPQPAARVKQRGRKKRRGRSKLKQAANAAAAAAAVAHAPDADESDSDVENLDDGEESESEDESKTSIAAVDENAEPAATPPNPQSPIAQRSTSQPIDLNPTQLPANPTNNPTQLSVNLTGNPNQFPADPTNNPTQISVNPTGNPTQLPVNPTGGQKAPVRKGVPPPAGASRPGPPPLLIYNYTTPLATESKPASESKPDTNPNASSDRNTDASPTTLTGIGKLGGSGHLPAMRSGLSDSDHSPDDIAKENEQLVIENTKLKRENEKLKTQSAKEYDDIVQKDEFISKLEKERELAVKQRDTNLSNLLKAEKGNAKLQEERDEALRIHKEEREKHVDTNSELRKVKNREVEWDAERFRYRDKITKIEKESAALKKTLAEKEALLAGADQAYDELQNSLRAAEEEAQTNHNAAIWLKDISKGLESSFSSLGQDLTAENLVNRYRELEQEQHRSSSPDFGQSLPKHRASDTRKGSLGDELARAANGDEETDDDLDGEEVTSEGELLVARQAAEKAKKESEEKGKRIKALEKKLAARPANGRPVGTVAAPVAREKGWWGVLSGAPWWAKAVWVLLVLLWATATMGAIHERQRWVWANVTPEMVRFYASPPTLDGVVGRMVGHGHGFGLHG